MRQTLIQDIQSLLNDTLGTPSHGCLLWRIVPLSGKLRDRPADLTNAQPNPYCDEPRLSNGDGLSIPSSAGLQNCVPPRRAELPLAVEIHPFMLEEENIAFKVTSRTGEHFPHSHFAINNT